MNNPYIGKIEKTKCRFGTSQAFYPADAVETILDYAYGQVCLERRALNSLWDCWKVRRKQLRQERHAAQAALNNLRIAFAELNMRKFAFKNPRAYKFWEKALERFKESLAMRVAREFARECAKNNLNLDPISSPLKSQYLMYRVCMEWDGKKGNIIVYKHMSPNLNSLLNSAYRNLQPLSGSFQVKQSENNRPDQESHPGCVFFGNLQHSFHYYDGSVIKGATYVAVYNVSRPEYSPGVKRESWDFDHDVSPFPYPASYEAALAAYANECTAREI